MRLNPIGLIVTALILAGTAVWTFRDEIKAGFEAVVRFAKNLYEGVKSWLTDKLGAVFDGVKDKVDAVTGFFGDMKDRIVGNSIVPDMVNQIGAEFDRMGNEMRTSSMAAVEGVQGAFAGLFNAAGGVGGIMDMVNAFAEGDWRRGLEQMLDPVLGRAAARHQRGSAVREGVLHAALDDVQESVRG